jgi:integral membrane protein (TIGR01906 family)
VKNNVYKSIEQEQTSLILDNLLNFFKGEESLEYFEEKEKSHLQDVKVLINKFFFVLNISFIVLIICVLVLFFLDKKYLKENYLKIIFLSGLCSFALLALLFLAGFNFSISFEGFHKIFFPQGNYAFPESSLLISLFPETFFLSFFKRLLLSSGIIAILLMLPQLILNKIKNKRLKQ